MKMLGDHYEETFLTVAEVAELLRLNQQTVRNWIDAGSLPAVRVGRRVRIKRSDLNRILENGYQGSHPAASNISGPSATDFWSGEPVGAAEPLSGERLEAETKASNPGSSSAGKSEDAQPSPSTEN